MLIVNPPPLTHPPHRFPPENTRHRYVYALVHKEVFRPIKKWGPLSFMQLTHVAFRVSFKKMVGLATKIKDESNAGARAKMCKKLFADFTMLKTITLLHARLEDSMLFPMVNLAFYDAAYVLVFWCSGCLFALAVTPTGPFRSKPAEEQHEALDKEMEEFEEVVNGLVRGGDGGADEVRGNKTIGRIDVLLFVPG